MKVFAEKVTCFCSRIGAGAKWLRLILYVLYIGYSGSIHADRWVNTQYNTTEGNEFYITTMKNKGASAENAPDLKFYLYATARKETRIHITNRDATYSEYLTIPANGQNGINIPLEVIYTDVADADQQVSVKDSFAVSIPQDKSLYVYTCNAYGDLDTTKSVSLYLTNYYQGNGYEATNILPVKALEREYMVQTYRQDEAASEFVVIATEDSQVFDLFVQLNENDNVIYTTTKTFECNKGETRLIRTATQKNSLAGTYVCSNANFVLLNGNQSAKIPSNVSHIFEQAFSTDKWGKEYVATPTISREFDYVMLTAMEDNTIITKDGVRIATLLKGETYRDKLQNNAAYYKSNNDFICYLYATGRNDESPAMTLIAPLTMGVDSIIVAAFNATANDLQLEGNHAVAYKAIKDHYINIVTESKYSNSIYFGDKKVENFQIVPGNNRYSYATYKIENDAANILKCKQKGGTFIARMYGDYYATEDDKENDIVSASYAYSAGSRVSRAVDMLIDDEYIKYKKICINETVKFTPLIDFEYESLDWVIQNNDSVVGYDHHDFKMGDSIYNHKFVTSGLHDVFLYVKSTSPICEKELYDTVTAQIMVDTLLMDRKYYYECYGGYFDEMEYGGVKYRLKADTVTEQNVDGNRFKFQLNTPKKFTEIIESKDSTTCDIQRIHTFTVRPTYDTIVELAVCEQYVWIDTVFEKRVNSTIDTIIDTVHTFEILPVDILPVTKEFTHSFKTQHKCDSTVTMRVTLNKSYEKDTIVDACQSLPGGTYDWEGHSGILHKYDATGNYEKVQEIALDKPGKFIYIDSLMTKQAPYCDSVHVLNLTIHPRYEDTHSVTICQNDTFYWDVNKIRYVGSAFPSRETNDVLLPIADSLYTFTEKFQTSSGCDSIYHLQLMVLPTYDTIVVAHICDNDEYSFNDTTFRGEKLDTQYGLKARSAPYEYTYSLSTAKGCDSVVTLQLYVHPTSLKEETVMICQGQSGVYEWKSDGITPPYWCQELGRQVDTIRLDQLGTFTYIDSALTASGCDDIHILHLIVGGYAIEDAPRYLCDNDTLVWHNRLYVGYNFNQSYDSSDKDVVELQYNPAQYVYRDSIVETSIQGCDSTHYLTLYVSPAYNAPVKIDTISLCDNESYAFYDSIYNQYGEWVSGDYTSKQYILTFTATTVNGCDSAVKHVINVHPTYQFETIESTCQYSDYVWKIAKRTASGGTIEMPVTGTVVDQDGKTLDASKISTDKVGNFTYTQAKTTKNGCDSILVLKLRIDSITEIYDTLQLCDNDTISWHNHLYVGHKYAGSYESESYDVVIENILAEIGTLSDTIATTNAYGCAQNYYLTLNIYSTYENVDSISTCDNNNPYVWITSDKNGVYTDSIYFTPSSEYIDPITNTPKKDIVHIDTVYRTLASMNDCDSVVQLYLTICPTYSSTTIDTICQSIGGTYDWVGHNKAVYSQEQGKKVSNISLDAIGNFTYVDSLQTTCCTECDSVHILQLTVLPSYIMRDTAMISEEETYDWSETNTTYGGKKTTLPHDVTIFQDTTVQHRLQTDSVGSYACDSVLCLTIIVGEVYRDTTYAAICGNETYTWVGKDRNGNDSVRMKIEVPQTQIYVDHHKTTLGFDSIFYLNLTAYPAYVGIDSMTTYARVCQDTEYEWKRPNANGHPKRLYSMDENRWINAADIPTNKQGVFTYKDSLYTINGCDSVYTLVLQIDSAYVFTDVIDICNDAYAIWEDTIYVGTQFTGVLPNDSMPVVTLAPQTNYLVDTLYKTITGCDSTRCLRLNVHPLYSVTDYQTTCDDNNQYIWETKDYLGSYYDTIQFVPSIEYLDPVTNKPKKDIIEIDTVFRSLTSVHGCDSIVQLHLTIYPVYKFKTNARICANDSIIWRGKAYYGAGRDTIYTEPHTTVDGCDSLYLLDLKKIPVSQTDITIHICTNCTDTMYHGNDSSQIIWYPEMYPRPTSKTITYKAAGTACDSIFNYRFIYHPSYQIDSTYSICSTDSVRIHDSLLFWMNKYYDPADSMDVPVLDTLVCDTLCAAYTCIGDDGLSITKCCDSIYTAHITVFPAYKHVDSVAICLNEVYYWLDSIPIRVSEVDEYHYDTLLKTTHGCDSIYELYLFVGQSYELEVYENRCEDDPYLFNDTLLYETGVYYNTFTTIDGCDSIVTLYLTVHDTTVLQIYDTICVTEKYDFYGTYLTEPGDYDTITLNEWGCKQYNYLHLELIDTTAYDISIGDVICADDEEIWVEYEWLSGRRLIEYSVFFDEYGHSQGFEDIIHAPLNPALNYFVIPIPRGEDLPKPNRPYFDSQQGMNKYVDETKQNYPEPNIYTIRVVMHNGICGDSLQVKDTTISFYYPSWIHEQHWNDGVVLYNEIYNGGYEFSEYQWYENGDTIYGATKEYLYIPSELLMNSRGDCENYYQVELTRRSDGYKTMTCPICPVLLFDSIVPQKDYFAIVPTVVDRRNSVVHVLSTRPGNYSYTVYNYDGQPLKRGSTFIPDDKNYGGIIDLSGINNPSVLITLTIDDGSWRTFTVRIK